MTRQRKFYHRAHGAQAVLLALLVLLTAGQGRAQDAFDDAADLMKESVQRIIVPKSALTSSPQVRRAFREVVERPSRATCRVLSHGDEVALGTIVDPDGWIVTKASSLDGGLACRLASGRTFDAELIGVDEAYDLALLKIDASRLPAVGWAGSRQTQVGQWAVTPGLGRDPLAVGVVSVLSREIPKPSGILGIVLEQEQAGSLIIHVLPDSGAERAGLQVGDVVTHCNGKRVQTRQALVLAVREFSPGDELDLTLRRDGEKLKLQATLTGPPNSDRVNRREIQNSMGSELSQRRDGFPHALQHDSVLRPADCGGPLVNLDGEALGVNIARAGRTESYAIPAEQVQRIVAELRGEAAAARSLK